MKMPWSRRSVLGGLAGGAIAGAGQMSKAQNLSHRGMPIAYDSSGEMAASAPYPTSDPNLYVDPPRRLMESWQAARQMMQDPDFRREMESEMYERYRHITHIDPDIMIMKSWSDMAKITFMRQRLVARDIAQQTSDPANPMRDKFVKKLQELMFGPNKNHL